MDARITAAGRLSLELEKLCSATATGVPIGRFWSERYCVGPDGAWGPSLEALRRLVLLVRQALVEAGDSDLDLVSVLNHGLLELVNPENFGLDSREFFDARINIAGTRGGLKLLSRVMEAEGLFDPFDAKNVQLCVDRIQEHMGATGCGTTGISSFIVENFRGLVFVLANWSLFGVEGVQDGLAIVDQRFADRIGRLRELSELDRRRLIAAAKIIELTSHSVLFGYRQQSAITDALERESNADGGLHERRKKRPIGHLQAGCESRPCA